MKASTYSTSKKAGKKLAQCLKGRRAKTKKTQLIHPYTTASLSKCKVLVVEVAGALVSVPLVEEDQVALILQVYHHKVSITLVEKGELQSLHLFVLGQAIVEEHLVVVLEDMVVVQEDMVVVQEDMVVVQEDMVVVQEDMVVVQEDMVVVQEHLAVVQEDMAVVQEDLVVAQEALVEVQEDMEDMEDMEEVSASLCVLLVASRK
ncbi:hypothetical protein AB205_0168520 [Aquarana catesbeiana]|uniref:Uncharacterized protein n=1 Tax=Aquarana catesbeiana TaxID=8400 RepID=A0A2G9SLR0_AQUCT|nr:hypothetical protein AB205_0168520 [Aquarana catesbeiana]